MRQIIKDCGLKEVPINMSPGSCSYCGYTPLILFTDFPLKKNMNSQELYLYTIEVSNRSYCFDCVERLFCRGRNVNYNDKLVLNSS